MLTVSAVDFGAAMIWVAALFLGALLLSAWLYARRSRTAHPSDAQGATPEQFGLQHFGAAGTVVQFSTAYCSKCPGVRRLLSDLTDERPGLRFQHLDVSERLDLIDAFRVRQTPTVLLIDSRGRVVTRMTGSVTRSQATQAIAQLIGDTT